MDSYLLGLDLEILTNGSPRFGSNQSLHNDPKLHNFCVEFIDSRKIIFTYLQQILINESPRFDSNQNLHNDPKLHYFCVEFIAILFVRKINE